MMSRSYAHKIPFIVKINHNELMTYPNEFDQIMFGSVEQAYDLGAAGVGATIYFGSPESHRQIIEVAEAFAHRPPARHVHRAVVLPAQQRLQGRRRRLPRLRRPHRPGQPPRRHHRGRHHQAEAARPTTAATTRCPGYGKTSKLVYGDLATDNPIDLRPLAGRQLLHGPHRAHQLRWRVQGRDRPGRRRAHRRHQQAGRRHRASSRAARRSSARWPRASSSSTPSRTSTSTTSVTIA